MMEGYSNPGPGMEEHEAKPGDESTAYLPASVLGGQKFQPGDEVVLKVVAVDEEDGSVEVAYSKGGGMGQMGRSGTDEIEAMDG